MVNFNKYISKIENNLKKEIDQELITLYGDLIKKSPVDKWVYLKWHKISKWQKVWNSIIWKIENNSDEAENVENWWRKSPVNWHKNRKKWWPVIFSWVWAKVYARTYFENKDRVLKKFKNISLID